MCKEMEVGFSGCTGIYSFLLQFRPHNFQGNVAAESLRVLHDKLGVRTLEENMSNLTYSKLSVCFTSVIYPLANIAPSTSESNRQSCQEMCVIIHVF